MRRRQQAPPFTIQFLVCTVPERSTYPFSVSTIGPAMVRAIELSGIAMLAATHWSAAMTAGVVKHMHNGIAVPDYNDFVLAYGAQYKVPRFRDLGFVRYKHPTLREDAHQFALVQLSIGEDGARHLTALECDLCVNQYLVNVL